MAKKRRIRTLPRDDDGAIRKRYFGRVVKAIETADVETLWRLVGGLHESDLGAVVEALAPDLRPRLVELLGIHFDFTALTEVDDAVREEILEELEPRTVAQGVRELESDDAVAILADLTKEDQAEILEQLPPPERVALAKSLDYPEDSAGRRMQVEFIAVPPTWDVGRAIDHMRETADLPEHFYELYVIDENRRFLGAVPLDRLPERCLVERRHRLAIVVVTSRHMLDRHARESPDQPRALRHLAVEADENDGDRAAMALDHGIGRQGRRAHPVGEAGHRDHPPAHRL